MKLYIPEIGSEIRLISDWTFNLYNEDRNSTLMEVTNDPRKTTWSGDHQFGAIPCTIPAGAVLKIDRIYIRKGLGEYSSLTFLWKGMRTNPKNVLRGMRQIMGPASWVDSHYEVKKPARPVRFWAKLDDVNNIEFDPV